MVRHPAQRHAVLGPGRQLDIEDARAYLGILKEHFVKVSEAKEQDRIWHLLLDVQILRDER
jgi:hypothetical protein